MNRERKEDTTPKGYSPEKIQYELRKNGLNQAAIARSEKVSPVTVSKVVRDATVSQRIHLAIANAIHEDVKRIWPQHYLNGAPKRGRKMIHWDRKAA